MPLNVNVGLSRKRSENYQSDGISINLTAELDATLLAKPEELQNQIDALYRQAEAAMDRQIAPAPPPRSSPPSNGRYRNGNGSTNGARSNGNGNRHGRTGAVAPMTVSQRRAIEAIAQRVNADATYEAREIAGAELDDLTIRQASELIDHLKLLQSSNTPRRN